MCFSTAPLRFASGFAIAEPEACGLPDRSGVCANAPPNTNVDTSTATIAFIKFSWGCALLRGIQPWLDHVVGAAPPTHRVSFSVPTGFDLTVAQSSIRSGQLIVKHD